MAGSKTTWIGVAFGMGAGALWGLVFLAPELSRPFSGLHIAIARYVFYGFFSACLLLPVWHRLKKVIGRREWLALAWLAFIGNVLYYILLSTAVQLGGIAMTSLIIGFLPVVVTIVGSRAIGAVPLRRLVPSLLLSIAGAVCIGWQALVVPTGAPFATQLIAFSCAVGALVTWSAYAVSNRRWLLGLEGVSAHQWNLLTGVMTLVLSALLVPVAWLLYRQSYALADWMRLAGVAMGVAVFASLIGNALWNRMSRLLPLTLVGQMILFETLFALIYGFLWERRAPTVLEALAFVLVILSVVSCLAAHRAAQPDRSMA